MFPRVSLSNRQKHPSLPLAVRLLGDVRADDGRSRSRVTPRERGKERRTRRGVASRALFSLL